MAVGQSVCTCRHRCFAMPAWPIRALALSCLTEPATITRTVPCLAYSATPATPIHVAPTDGLPRRACLTSLRRVYPCRALPRDVSPCRPYPVVSSRSAPRHPSGATSAVPCATRPHHPLSLRIQPRHATPAEPHHTRVRQSASHQAMPHRPKLRNKTV